MEYKTVYEGEKAKELIYQSIQDENDIEKISIINTKINSEEIYNVAFEKVCFEDLELLECKT